MATIDVIRTTAFRLAAEHFGRVFVYRPGPRFSRVWEQLEQQWRGDAEQARLPYRGLAVALRVLSGDFVALQRRVAGDRAFVISRRRISSSDFAIAVGAWESNALRTSDEPITRVLDDLACDEVDVLSHVQHRPGRCPTISDGANWVWDVAIWELAHRLANTPLQTETGPARLRLDSDAALLTWDRVVRPEGNHAAAMHKIELQLITVPGVEAPVVSLQSSLVRLAPAWRETGGARYAWADVDPTAPLLRGRVRNRRDATTGGFTTLWDDRAAEVLRGASFRPLPDTSGEPSLDGTLRTGYARQPSSHRIGRGVGTWFHELVSHHARQTLGPQAQCVELQTSRAFWPTQRKVAPRPSLDLDRSDPPRLRLLVVYANSGVRRRLRDAIVKVLGKGARPSDGPGLAEFGAALHELSDGAVLVRGPIEVRFVRPPDAERWLLRRNAEPAIEAWLNTWFPEAGRDVRAAIVETDESARNGRDDLADPKPVLRARLARRGVVSQFISESSSPSSASRRRDGESDVVSDHGAENAVGDMLRSAGFFLRPFPAFGVEKGTLAVGVYGTRVTSKTTGRGSSYLANVVAVSLGGHEAWGFTEPKGWCPLDEATAWFLATDHALSDVQARQRVERAIGQLPLALSDRRAILLFDALGCRRFWSCLTDKSDGSVDAWMRANSAAVVRVRTTSDEVLRPAGAGPWDTTMRPAKHTNFRPMTVAGTTTRTPTFVLSGSAVMSQGQSARKSSRFATSARGIREDWHSLGTTELLVLERGGWEPETLIAQVAMLCRIAPTWDRTLRWPSPLHLARAVVRNHPHGYFADGDEAEESEDGRQMRFDIGIFS